MFQRRRRPDPTDDPEHTAGSAPLQSLSTQAAPFSAPARPLPTIYKEDPESVALSELVSKFQQAFKDMTLAESLSYIGDTGKKLRDTPLMKGECWTWAEVSDCLSQIDQEPLRDWAVALPSGTQRQIMFQFSVICRGWTSLFDQGRAEPPSDGVPYTEDELRQAREQRAVFVRVETLNEAQQAEKRSWKEVADTVAIQSVLELNKSIQTLCSALSSCQTRIDPQTAQNESRSSRTVLGS